MTDIAIQCQDLGHWYRKDEWVFRDYSLTVSSVLAVLGSNGAGKTTLLRILLNVLKPKHGSVSVSKRVGFVPQLFEMRFDYLVLDVVLMGRVRSIGLWNSPSAIDRSVAMASLGELGIERLANHNFQSLSGGERQMVMTARALASGAELLVLDEPTSSLDLQNQQVILQWTHRLALERGLTVVFTTHNPEHAHAVADQVLLMKRGSDYLHGPTDTILNEENLRALYGIDVRKVQI